VFQWKKWLRLISRLQVSVTQTAQVDVKGDEFKPLAATVGAGRRAESQPEATAAAAAAAVSGGDVPPRAWMAWL
jgi:hypothetical protein